MHNYALQLVNGKHIIEDARMNPDRPNILFILSDQHRADYLGTVGHAFLQTPHLDALARESVLFARAYCGNPLCVPSRMALMTGQSSGAIRVWGNGNILDSTIPTFAHGLTAAGYETVLAGKMHFCGSDQYHGFSQRLVGEVSPELLDAAYAASGNGESWAGNNAYAIQASGAGHCGFGYYDEQVADSSVQFIESQQQGATPWCLVSGFISPHNPYVCDPSWFDHYLDQVALPKDEEVKAVRRAQPYLDLFVSEFGLENLEAEGQKKALAAYCGICTELDRRIGKMIRALQATGQWENTVVIYTSDHGESAGEGGLWFKTTLTEASARVPLMIRVPGGQKGVVSQELVSLFDLAPTLLDAAEAEPLPRTDGISLLPLVQGGEALQRHDDFVWAESIGTKDCRHVFACWHQDWKYVDVPALGQEYLFDLRRDPKESNNLSGVEARVLQEMRERRQRVWSYEQSKQALEDYNQRIRYLRSSPEFKRQGKEMPQCEVPESWHDFKLG